MQLCCWAPGGNVINHLLLMSPSKYVPGWGLFRN